MARSFKKTPGYTNSGSRGRKFAKRWANRKVRQIKGDLPNGGSYRKVYDSWNICDFKTIYYTPVMYRDYVNKLWRDYKKGDWLRDQQGIASWAGQPKRK